MSVLKNIFHYSYGNVLVVMAGLISFPVFTRMLSPENYGLMSLLNLCASLCLVFTKGGLQQAVVKYWNPQNGDAFADRLVSTAFLGLLFIAIPVLVVFFGTATVYAWVKGDPSLIGYAAVVGIWVFFDAGKLVVMNFYRSLQKASLYNVMLVGTKYLQIFFAIGFLVFFAQSGVLGVFYGFVAGSLIVLAGALFLSRDLFHVRMKSFDPALFRQMIVFGFPLVGYELLNQLLVYGDRIIIKFHLGNAAVGLYSAAYNLTFNVQTVMVTSVSLAIYPNLVATMNERGLAEAHRYIERSLEQFILYGGLITAGFAGVGADLLILMSGREYLAGAAVIPAIIGGALAYGIFSVASGELFILGKTTAMTRYMFVGALCNLSLNLWLVPRYGIMGAGYATLGSQVLLGALGIFRLGRKGSSQFRSYLIRSIPALAVYAALFYYPAGVVSVVNLVAKTALGCLVWGICSFLLVDEFRKLVASVSKYLVIGVPWRIR